MDKQTLLWLLGAALTLAVLMIGRYWTIVDGLRKENQALRDTNVDLKIAVSELKGTTHAVNRTLSSVMDTLETPGKGGPP
jgi:hypothetical protein